MSNKLYDVLNKIQRWLPALASFYLGLTAIWPLPYGNEVNNTIALIATFLAATLEVFSAQWNKDHEITITNVNKKGQ
jgi:hypothetical protein